MFRLCPILYAYDKEVGRPLEEVADAKSRTGTRVQIPKKRIPQTRFYCEHCNVPLCNNNARGNGKAEKRECFAEFHAHIQLEDSDEADDSDESEEEDDDDDY
ncbi:hypothetical protein BJ508DRAFT_304563 [Ascobolus immersus RN42]|uniref:Uncharacterized protein n=1 Tax=Ascobolus immersus RN42 TaxID=1160509 RepID=A0A3N4IC77_ASCIM|nr:hypothetical protein BJ508DRAFT_304563 [Ascobolus immersus RN42]